MRENLQEALTLQECWDLLRTGTARLGRVALSVEALPTILPVQYQIDGTDVAICLAHHNVPPQSVDNTIVAFGTDDIDSDNGPDGASR